MHNATPCLAHRTSVAAAFPSSSPSSSIIAECQGVFCTGYPLSCSSNTCTILHLDSPWPLAGRRLGCPPARHRLFHTYRSQKNEVHLCQGYHIPAKQRQYRFHHGLANYTPQQGTCQQAKQVHSAFAPSEKNIKNLGEEVKRTGLKTNPTLNLENGACEVQAGYKSKSNDNVGLLAAHVDYISSVNNIYVKHLVRLRQCSSYRRTVGEVVVVGSIPLREICEATSMKGKIPHHVEVLLLLKDTVIPPILAECSRRTVFVNAAVLHKLAGLDSADSVDCVGLLKIPSLAMNLSTRSVDSDPSQLHKWCLSPHRVLVLDGIQDPGNLGTLLRSAAAFAWDGVFLLPGCCDPFNDKALRASRGATFRIPIASGTWDKLQAFSDLHSMRLYAADPEQVGYSCISNSGATHGVKELVIRVPLDGAENMNWNLTDNEKRDCSSHVKSETCEDVLQEKDEDKFCLVLGSEGQGLSDEARKYCQRVTIPMPGDFESLNVAVAGGILLFLLRKS
ncbi:hypothetical protein O6H91_15G074200 [Diphasiastrum complanatum]|uniref:Uncharacterized protein n=2 Tax=Diphasiastrum complanatum TaxID=34168 RepID=A0ACC2BKQ8_DIPCM|nr:hypothetical protein O6H91_15G074200 [Diphasiastrum complanatum]KAJ7529997.1 hypothetical protein O6H91_15G074200 [Diphasiastrum complanatum]